MPFSVLSPTLALGLRLAKSRLLPNNLEILTFPTAGASPGNIIFAEAYGKAFESRLDQGGYQVLNDDLFNAYDIVPQVWCTNTSASPDRSMHSIQPIYGKLPVIFGTEVAFAIWRDVERSD